MKYGNVKRERTWEDFVQDLVMYILSFAWLGFFLYVMYKNIGHIAGM